MEHIAHHRMFTNQYQFCSIVDKHILSFLPTLSDTIRSLHKMNKGTWQIEVLPIKHTLNIRTYVDLNHTCKPHIHAKYNSEEANSSKL